MDDEETESLSKTSQREPIQSESEEESSVSSSDDEYKGWKQEEEKSASDHDSDSSDEGSDDEDEEGSSDDVQISNKEIQHAIALATDAARKKFGWKKETKVHESGLSNPLSEVIPGYVAPMTLDSSSLNKYKNTKRLLADASGANNHSTEGIVISNKPTFQSKNLKLSKPDPVNLAKSSTNAGSGWFNFEATPSSSALQADIAIIRNRNYIDPKKFYKASDFNKRGAHRVQLGTVIEGSMESVYSNRLSKKQRKENVLEEVMGDVFGTKDAYVKKKFTKMQAEKSLAGQKRTKRKQKGKGNFRR